MEVISGFVRLRVQYRASVTLPPPSHVKSCLVVVQMEGNRIGVDGLPRGSNAIDNTTGSAWTTTAVVCSEAGFTTARTDL